MAKGTRRHKARAKAKQRKKPAPTSVHDLPDELLDRVLLELGSPLDLVRAAATCRRWRRAVAEEGFLARSRSLHGAPPAAGHYYNVGDTLPPSSNELQLRRPPPPEKPMTFVPMPPAIVDGCHFSLDFLYVPPDEPPTEVDRRRCMYQCPRRARHSRVREIIDSRGSLLLLSNRPWLGVMSRRRRWPDFLVCEPVTRRCQGIARPASLSHLLFLGGFLLGGSGGRDDAMADFRVLSVLYEQDGSFGTPRACVFTPGSDGGWHRGWHQTDDDDDGGGVELPSINQIHLAGRAAGMIYWGMETGTVLVLNETTLMFSLLELPPPLRWPYRSTSFRVIGGEGDNAAVRVVRLDGQDLEIYGQLPGSGGQWVVEKSLRLSDAAAGLPDWRDSNSAEPARIVDAGDTFVVLTRAEKTWLFSVELDTMEVERRHERNRHVGPAYQCALPWPPVLQACVNC